MTPVRNWVHNQSLIDEGYWTLELCIKEAAKYYTRDKWEEGSPISYKKAIKRGWLTKCMQHNPSFKRKASVPAIWTLEKCIELARKCNRRKDFKVAFCYPYEKARQNGWLDVCCAHMK